MTSFFQTQQQGRCMWSSAVPASLLLPAACPEGKRWVAGRVSGAARRFVRKRTRHGLSVGAKCFIGGGGSGKKEKPRYEPEAVKRGTVTTFRRKKHEPTAREQREELTGGGVTSPKSFVAPPASKRVLLCRPITHSSTHYLVKQLRNQLADESIQKDTNR